MNQRFPAPGAVESMNWSRVLHVDGYVSFGAATDSQMSPTALTASGPISAALPLMLFGAHMISAQATSATNPSNNHNTGVETTTLDLEEISTGFGPVQYSALSSNGHNGMWHQSGTKESILLRSGTSSGQRHDEFQAGDPAANSVVHAYVWSILVLPVRPRRSPLPRRAGSTPKIETAGEDPSPKKQNHQRGES